MRNYRASEKLLSGRVILITGAGAGIGQSAALACARCGAQTVLHGRDVEKLELVCQSIENIPGAPQPLMHPLDLSAATELQFQSLAELLDEAFGKLDGLLHNAAQLGRLGPLEHIPPPLWERVLQVNLTAPFLLTRALLPLLRAAPDASVVFTSSGVGKRGQAFWGAYAASKFAIEGLAQTLADELENTSQVRVNTIDPGACNTAMRRAAFPAENPSDNPDPDDIIDMWLYLLGPESRNVTGRRFDAQSDAFPGS